jgi:hemerythrin-like domain-containing protein
MQPGDASHLRASDQAFSSSAAVREFAAIHRLIRGFILLLAPAVDRAQAGDHRLCNQTLAKAMQFCADGIRYHHYVEDHHFWPALVAHEADESALTALSVEHSQLDPLIDQLESLARRLGRNPADPDVLESSKALFVHFSGHVLSHLDHEEPVFFPLLVQHMPDQEASSLSAKATKHAPRRGVSWLVGAVTYGMRAEESGEFFRSAPKPVVIMRPFLLRKFLRNCAILGIEPESMS